MYQGVFEKCNREMYHEGHDFSNTLQGRTLQKKLDF